MFHKVKSISPQDNCVLGVCFEDGTQKIYDVKQLFDRFPMFKVLQSDNKLFNSVKVDQGGFGISWNDELDLACDDLYFKGK